MNALCFDQNKSFGVPSCIDCTANLPQSFCQNTQTKRSIHLRNWVATCNLSASRCRHKWFPNYSELDVPFITKEICLQDQKAHFVIGLTGTRSRNGTEEKIMSVLTTFCWEVKSYLHFLLDNSSLMKTEAKKKKSKAKEREKKWEIVCF